VERIESEIRYGGPNFVVSHGRYRRADGDVVERDLVEHPGSVAILAHDGEVVHLVRQPREVVGEDAMLEIPAGTIDAGESPLECAKRELAEEVGLEAESWTELQVIYPSPGYTDERETIFEATGLGECAAEPDEDERIEVVRLPVSEIEASLPELRDATTLIALLLLLRRA
jgi:ADP-ribose pyrophosphatase